MKEIYEGTDMDLVDTNEFRHSSRAPPLLLDGQVGRERSSDTLSCATTCNNSNNNTLQRCHDHRTSRFSNCGEPSQLPSEQVKLREAKASKQQAEREGELDPQTPGWVDPVDDPSHQHSRLKAFTLPST